jgi:hypothetical protein
MAFDKKHLLSKNTRLVKMQDNFGKKNHVHLFILFYTFKSVFHGFEIIGNVNMGFTDANPLGISKKRVKQGKN